MPQPPLTPNAPALLADVGGTKLAAPMPGLIIRYLKNVGDIVAEAVVAASSLAARGSAASTSASAFRTPSSRKSRAPVSEASISASIVVIRPISACAPVAVTTPMPCPAETSDDENSIDERSPMPAPAAVASTWANTLVDRSDGGEAGSAWSARSSSSTC